MNLIDVLGTKLVPAGPNGFEGLVAGLLSNLTGMYFRLARSGSQQGRDAGAFPEVGNVIAVECKRYTTTSLNSRELQGELLQAVVSTPELDIWALVTTATIDAQLANELRQAAELLNIVFLAIEGGDNKPSSLEVLCATHSRLTEQYLSPVLSSSEQVELRELLNQVAAHPDFARIADCLRESFAREDLGLASWQRSMKECFATQTSTVQRSRAAFAQELDVNSSRNRLVPRIGLWTALDRWISNWASDPEPFVVLGEEGDGKTWGVASWCSNQLRTNADFPPPILISSVNLKSDDPEDLLSSISDRATGRKWNRWIEKIHRWLDAPVYGDSEPICIIVLDGINEHHSFETWRVLLESLSGDDKYRRIAILVTCRSDYWKRTFGRIGTVHFQTFELSPFNDEELQQALELHQLRLADFSIELLPLVRKPRYFDLAVRFGSKLTELGDFTKARLIYEEWKDRWERKTNTLLTDLDFQLLLRDLAQRQLEGNSSISYRAIGSSFPSTQDYGRMLEDLRTSGVLHAKHDGATFVVEQNRLELGLGLLLADQLEDTGNRHEVADLIEVVLSWLEPQAGTDIKARICEYAFLHMLHSSSDSRNATVALLVVWLGSQNPSAGSEVTIASYLPENPTCYVVAAEFVWSDMRENRWAQSLLVSSFLAWFGRTTRVDEVLASAFDRWLTFVHLSGFSWMRGVQDESRQQVQAAILERIQNQIVGESVVACGRQFQIICDDGLLRLSRVALAVISHLPRQRFVRSIADGCVAEAIMGQPDKYDLFKWVLLTSEEDLWVSVETEAQRLLSQPHRFAKQAAARLLRFEGSTKAELLRSSLPSDLFPLRPGLEEWRDNPCTSGQSWKRKHCEECLHHTDIDLTFAARQINVHSIDPALSIPDRLSEHLAKLLEEIAPNEIWSTFVPTVLDRTYLNYELTLCAHAPLLVAGFVRNVVNTLEVRGKDGRRRLSLQLSQLDIILSAPEIKVLQDVWVSLCDTSLAWQEAHQTTEMMLFGVLLAHWSAEEQLRNLIRRPPQADDLLSFHSSFAPLTDWSVIDRLFREYFDVKTLSRILWFMSANVSAIPDTFVETRLIPLLNHPESIVRALVLNILSSGLFPNALLDAARTWQWSPNFLELENHWGSIAIANARLNVDFAALSERVHPAYWARILVRETVSAADVQVYAKLVDSYWSNIVSTVTPEDLLIPAQLTIERNLNARPLLDVSAQPDHALNSRARNSSWGGSSHSEPVDVIHNIIKVDTNELTIEQDKRLEQLMRLVQAQRSDGNYWFAEKFFGDVLDKVIAQEPLLVTKWLGPVLDASRASKAILYASHSLYEALCEALFKVDPKSGVRLHSRLCEVSIGTIDSVTEWRLIDTALFGASPVQEVQDYWRNLLLSCKSDREMLHFVCQMELGTAQSWLYEYLEQLVHVG